MQLYNFERYFFSRGSAVPTFCSTRGGDIPSWCIGPRLDTREEGNPSLISLSVLRHQGRGFIDPLIFLLPLSVLMLVPTMGLRTYEAASKLPSLLRRYRREVPDEELKMGCAKCLVVPMSVLMLVPTMWLRTYEVTTPSTSTKVPDEESKMGCAKCLVLPLSVLMPVPTMGLRTHEAASKLPSLLRRYRREVPDEE